MDHGLLDQICTQTSTHTRYPPNRNAYSDNTGGDTSVAGGARKSSQSPANLIQHHIGLVTPEEDTAIIKGVQELGNNPGRWTDIKRMFPVELAQKPTSQISNWRLLASNQAK